MTLHLDQASVFKLQWRNYSKVLVWVWSKRCILTGRFSLLLILFPVSDEIPKLVYILVFAYNFSIINDIAVTTLIYINNTTVLERWSLAFECKKNSNFALILKNKAEVAVRKFVICYGNYSCLSGHYSCCNFSL